MKKLMCVVPALLLFAMIGAPNANADSYTPTFSCTEQGSSDRGCYYIGASYTAPDVSFPAPTVQATINTTFGGGEINVYDVTLAAGDSPADTYSYQISEYNGSAPSRSEIPLYATLSIDDLTTGMADTATDFLNAVGVIAPPVEGDGALVFSAVSAAAPESAPLLLLVLGVGLILFLPPKRFVTRAQGAA